MSRQERSQRNATPKAADPFLRVSPASALAQLAGRYTTRLGLEHGTRDTPAAGGDARAAATGFNISFAKPWWCSRPVGEPNTEGRRSKDPKGREKDLASAHPA